MAGEVATRGGRPVEGRVVTSPARQGGGSGPRTEYVYVQGAGSQEPARSQRRLSWTPGPAGRAQVPRGVPGFMGNRGVIFGTWAVAMAVVTWDEWSVNNILPRPARLWDTTWVYAGLALLSVFDMLVPIANALALGYTLVLLYQFFSKKGQFGGLS